jgi:hypothetical protein
MPPDARVILEQHRQRQDRIIQDVAMAGCQNRAALACGVSSTTVGCRAFTRELRKVVWPMNFKPELPPRYDGVPDPTKFLQLYALSVEAAGGDDKVMANWLPMALKDGTRSWLLNLPEESVSSWSDLCELFVVNFRGSHDPSLTINDLRRMK